MRTVFIAGATGCLGRFLCAEYSRRGWHVTALARHGAGAASGAARRSGRRRSDRGRGHPTGDPTGIMGGADLVVSALGITRQADGLSYRAVDYRANLNMLREAERADVGRFARVRVLNADAMRHVPLFA